MKGSSRARVVGVLVTGALALGPGVASAAPQETTQTATHLQPADVFGLEWAGDPRVSPDGSRVVYVRNFFDVMTDRGRSNLWLVDVDGSAHRPLTTGNESDASPRWSPDGDRLVYVSSRGEEGAELWVRWMDASQQEAKITNLTESPSDVTWSPDGRWIAFTMFVPSAPEPFARMPTKPEGAEWAEPARVVDDVQYRADGSPGFLRDGNTHLFVVPADGGTPRRLTRGAYDHGQPSWTPDGRSILVSANRRDDAELEAPNDTEIWEVAVADGTLRPLTDRFGPDGSPTVSPDGRLVAYTGFDDDFQGYRVTKLYVMNRDGSGRRMLAADLDRDVGGPVWARDSGSLLVQYDDEGDTRVARVGVDGSVTDVVPGGVGGLSLGRPYAGGTFSAAGGVVAFTHTAPDHPSDVAVVDADGGEIRRLTRLNEDLLGHRELGEVEEIWWESSFDGRPVQGWIVKPPGFDPTGSHPMVLEIHGGPFANYGVRFSAEIQLYAAAGYVVLYTNPRGSTSYGQEFGNLIHHAYPGNDYDDLMSGVDAVLERGYVDPDRLYVTGGSGGGVLTAWIVGSTDRFRAAVVQKPVINWSSFVLTADATPFFSKYWFPGFPWEEPEHYWERSPLSRVGDVTTPTMLLTGEEDYRTPISESE
ncbi:MAG TPA: S9 family peptidase, partial [Longimicrobiales bacterium]|nr:S9 family peptidase [Longimicrobiales bacterium]